jgi:hypothetical protein
MRQRMVRRRGSCDDLPSPMARFAEDPVTGGMKEQIGAILDYLTLLLGRRHSVTVTVCNASAGSMSAHCAASADTAQFLVFERKPLTA